ncbi:MAG: hypothetical protein HY288_04110 [Planctomycetia bacterium]|nr:hypothetical protein [Planctomycetia bacterium]
MSRTSYFILFGLFGCFVWEALKVTSEHQDRQSLPSASKMIAANSVSEESSPGSPVVPVATTTTVQMITAEQQDTQKGLDQPTTAVTNAKNLPADPALTESPAGNGENLAVSPALPNSSAADGPNLPASPTPGESAADEELAPVPAGLVVHTDYREAMQEAAEDCKMLFIYFHEPGQNAARVSFETLTLADEEIQEKLKRYVFVKLPRDASITIDGKSVSLLGHPAFGEMLGRQGVAIVDLVHVRSEYYGYVVSTFPFTAGKYYRKEALSIILDLPPGTLTQRTMIYAVRIHPEAPASTQGQFHTVLAEEAKMSADHQASILLQGHHSWDARFQRINAKLPSGLMAQEVVAESWPNENLVEACVDCVHSWRQSPGHWGAVRARHPLFGYDIKRGRNGIWYATGIFGLR